jgi:drug/metabolite transporter (DMT)-like permease
LILLGSVFGPVVGVALLMLSVQCIPSGVAQTLASLTPVTILPLVMILHKERVSARAFIGAAIAVAGVGMLVW